MKKYNVVVSPDFKIMLDEILNMYLQCSPLYVRKILKEINLAFEILEKFPYLMQTFPSNNNLRRYVIHKRFSILYRIDNNEIDILYFIDNRMQNGNYLAEEIEVYQV